MPRRNSKGRFVKGSKRTSSRRSSRGGKGSNISVRVSAPTSKRGGGKRRGHRGVAGEGLKPSKHTLESWGLAGLYGYLEGKARGDSSFMLNRVPKPVPQIGFTGNVALLAWAGGHLGKMPLLKRFGNSVAHVAVYQLGLHGSAFSSGDEFFSVSGMPGISGPGDNARLSAQQLAALANAMHDAAATASGVPFEPEVLDAVAHE